MDEDILIFLGVIALVVAFIIMTIWPLLDEWMKDLDEGDDTFIDKW